MNLAKFKKSRTEKPKDEVSLDVEAFRASPDYTRIIPDDPVRKVCGLTGVHHTKAPLVFTHSPLFTGWCCLDAAIQLTRGVHPKLIQAAAAKKGVSNGKRHKAQKEAPNKPCLTDRPAGKGGPTLKRFASRRAQ